jgi:effector-binding domain-containing protein
MIDTPKIVTSMEQHAAAVHVTVPRSEIQKVMGPGLTEVKAAVTEQGLAEAGPWFSHHLKMDPKVFDFEICVPVKKPVTAKGRVKPQRLAARKVARTVYHGGYEGLGAAWGELQEWVKAQGLKPAPELWEVYVSGPETGKGPDSYRTELNQPLAE